MDLRMSFEVRDSRESGLKRRIGRGGSKGVDVTRH